PRSGLTCRSPTPLRARTGSARDRAIDHPTRRAGAAPYNRSLSGSVPMQVAASSFKAYDIRGVVGKTIYAAFAEHLGRAFGSAAVEAGERAVAVGRDGRVSGPELSAAVIRGLVSTGLDV